MVFITYLTQKGEVKEERGLDIVISRALRQGVRGSNIIKICMTVGLLVWYLDHGNFFDCQMVCYSDSLVVWY